jgi:hypothetical protein
MRSIFLVAIVLAASTAVAQPKKKTKLSPEAKQHMELALAAYGKADYDTAAREFGAAYEIDKEPSLLYGMAQAKRLGGHCAEAVPLYQRYLETKPNKSQVAAARSGIKLCEGAASKPTPDPTPPPDPTPAPASDPPPTPDPTPAPPAADPVAPPVDPVVVASPPPPPRDAPPWYTDRLAGFVTLGGIAVAGIGVGYLVAYRGTMSDADGAMFLDEYDDLLAKATTQRRIAVVGLGVGSAAIISGVLLYTMRDRAPRDVAVGTDGRSLYFAGEF